MSAGKQIVPRMEYEETMTPMRLHLQIPSCNPESSSASHLECELHVAFRPQQLLS